MPVEVVSYMLSSQDVRMRLQFQIVLQCAPLLKGIKVACVMNIGERDCAELDGLMEGTGIDYRILSAHKGRCLVYFYREEELARHMRKREVCEFLRLYGYETEDLEKVLRRLSERACQYSGSEGGFPHEIGAFLDYPIEDVRCFIEQEGRECLIAGYWKVYHNPAQAQMIFLAYDKAKASAVNELLTGKSMRDIVYQAA